MHKHEIYEDVRICLSKNVEEKNAQNDIHLKTYETDYCYIKGNKYFCLP